MNQNEYPDPLLPLEAADAETPDTDQGAFDFSAKPVNRCGSCGAPIDVGDVCPSCRHAFDWVFDDVAVGAALQDENAAVEPIGEDAVASFADFAELPHAAHAAAQPPPPADGQTAVRSRRINPMLALVVGAGALFLLPIVGVLIGTHGTATGASPEQSGAEPASRTPAPAAGNDAVGVPVGRTSAADALPRESAKVDAKPKTAPPASRTPTSPRPPARSSRAADESANGSRPANSSPEPAAEGADTVATATTAEPIPVPTPPPAPVAARVDDPVLPQAPTGRFFDARDVDESPKVATRVTPRLPADLQQRPVDDVVIVRMLVSQSGHPFRVSLLRRSKGGEAVDDAVIAAVKQWTFQPARKRGEAVSCWLNFGVPVSAD